MCLRVCMCVFGRVCVRVCITSNLWDRYKNQLQRFSVALTKLRGHGLECRQFKAMRPQALKMLKDMVDSTAHRYRKP